MQVKIKFWRHQMQLTLLKNKLFIIFCLLFLSAAFSMERVQDEHKGAVGAKKLEETMSILACCRELDSLQDMGSSKRSLAGSTGAFRHCYMKLVSDKDGAIIDSIGYFDVGVRPEPVLHGGTCEVVKRNATTKDWDKVQTAYEEDDAEAPYDARTHNCCTAAKKGCEALGEPAPAVVTNVNFGVGTRNQGGAGYNCAIQ